MRKLKNAGKIDGVTFIDQVRGDEGVPFSVRLLVAFVFEPTRLFRHT